MILWQIQHCFSKYWHSFIVTEILLSHYYMLYINNHNNYWIKWEVLILIFYVYMYFLVFGQDITAQFLPWIHCLICAGISSWPHVQNDRIIGVYLYFREVVWLKVWCLDCGHKKYSQMYINTDSAIGPFL